MSEITKYQVTTKFGTYHYVLAEEHEREVAALKAAIQKADDCIEVPHENDAILTLCRVQDILRAALHPEERT